MGSFYENNKHRINIVCLICILLLMFFDMVVGPCDGSWMYKCVSFVIALCGVIWYATKRNE